MIKGVANVISGTRGTDMLDRRVVLLSFGEQ